MSAIPSAATIQAAFASWQEPLVEFFPRNAAPGERFFWRNAAEASSSSAYQPSARPTTEAAPSVVISWSRRDRRVVPVTSALIRIRSRFCESPPVSFTFPIGKWFIFITD